MNRRAFLPIAGLAILAAVTSAPARQPDSPASSRVEYRLLATNKTSTMQKEMNAAAEAGFRFEAVMGGDTALGGSEVVAVMSKTIGAPAKARYEYKLLATNKTSTMQKELQEAADAGFEYRDQSVFSSMFGGQEVSIILERDRDQAKPEQYEYRLLATKKTGTMQKELQEAGDQGFTFVGVTVAPTAFGGHEVVSILRRRVDL
jgi:hypothetical protein